MIDEQAILVKKHLLQLHAHLCMLVEDTNIKGEATQLLVVMVRENHRVLDLLHPPPDHWDLRDTGEWSAQEPSRLGPEWVTHSKALL